MVNWKKLVNKIPARVQIKKNLYYDVVWRDEFPTDHDQVGETDDKKKLITIKRGLSPKETIRVYLHELLHAYSDVYGAKFTESQIRKMEKSFYFLLKDGNIFKEGK